jgi:hypothetical protein
VLNQAIPQKKNNLPIKNKIAALLLQIQQQKYNQTKHKQPLIMVTMK